MSHYSSAGEMSRDLGLPLLLQSDVSMENLHYGQLRPYATWPFQSGAFYRRLLASLSESTGRVDFAGFVLGIAGIPGRSDQSPWAIGLADQLSRAGLRVYLLGDLPIDPRATSVQKLAIPESFAQRLNGLLPDHACAMATDLEGVRVIVSDEHPAAPEHANDAAPWCAVVTMNTPDAGRTAFDIGHVDAAVLSFAFTRTESPLLRMAVQRVRDAGVPILGIIGIGPGDPADYAFAASDQPRRQAAIPEARSEEHPHGKPMTVSTDAKAIAHSPAAAHEPQPVEEPADDTDATVITTGLDAGPDPAVVTSEPHADTGPAEPAENLDGGADPAVVTSEPYADAGPAEPAENLESGADPAVVTTRLPAGAGAAIVTDELEDSDDWVLRFAFAEPSYEPARRVSDYVDEEPEAERVVEKPAGRRSEYRDEEPAHRGSEYPDEEPAHRESEYRDEEPAHRESEYRDEEPARRESEHRDEQPAHPESEYRDEELAHPETEYRDEEPAYPESEYPDEEPAHRGSEYIDEGPVFSLSLALEKFRAGLSHRVDPNDRRTAGSEDRELAIDPVERFETAGRFDAGFHDGSFRSGDASGLHDGSFRSGDAPRLYGGSLRSGDATGLHGGAFRSGDATGLHGGSFRSGDASGLHGGSFRSGDVPGLVDLRPVGEVKLVTAWKARTRRERPRVRLLSAFVLVLLVAATVMLGLLRFRDALFSDPDQNPGRDAEPVQETDPLNPS
jgi:hypothetical protein